MYETLNCILRRPVLQSCSRVFFKVASLCNNSTDAYQARIQAVDSMLAPCFAYRNHEALVRSVSDVLVSTMTG
jgi:hypothetical protein